MTRPRIAVLTTGGTVASRSTSSGTVPVLSAEDLLATHLHASTSGSEHPAPPVVVPTELMSVDSSSMVPADQFRIVRAVSDALADPRVAGVVVTHGTDTVEETAFLTDLYLDAMDTGAARPVVFTGAVRPADSPEPDGPANIASAVRIATDPASRGRGVLIALGGRVLSARGAFKASTTSVTAFDTVHARLARPSVPGPVPAGRTARVDAFAMYPGMSAGMIAASVAQQAAGIVIAGTGSGNTHPDITAEVALARQRGVEVVVTTRVPFGPVSATYGGGGGAVDLERAGAVTSRWLRAPQARMALMALLSGGADHDAVLTFFATSAPAA